MARASSIHVCSDCGHESAALARAAARAAGVEHAGRGARVAAAGVRPGPRAAAAGARARRAAGRARATSAPPSVARLRDRHRRARPRARRRARARLARAARRLAGDRQVDADDDGARPTSPRPAGARSTSAARSRPRRSGCAPSGSAPAARCAIPVLAETDLDAVLATLEAERPDVCVIDSVQTLHAAELTGAPGSVGPGARGRRRSHARRQGARHRGAPRRPRDQGGRARRPARARAPGRLRAAVRGRARAHLPRRCARSRTASARPTRSACSRCATDGLVEVLDASARFVGEATRAPGLASCWRDGGLAAAARRGAGARRAVGARAAAPRRHRDRPQPPGARARGARPPRRRRRSGAADVFVNVVGGVRVDEPGADLAVALAVASARARGVAAGDERAAAPASASSA